MIKFEKSKGFTLIELLVSLAIVGTILLAFFKIIDSTNRMNVKNDRDIKALNIAQSEIENLRSQIKEKADNNERELFVYDNSLDSNDKKIEISFDKKNEYFRIYEDADIKYKICLDIKREMVKEDTFNDYIYTINITVQLEDKYFSKKITEINNVKILGIGKNQSS
ncbi:MAG TPA: type II secretion system GspH family protein [Romboutsia timonensis]|uniref:Type II secretion system GspH family protein n=1 Tax=Romboutsia timonensis TaxID=1776391 RepID=A0A921N267_9FIRM|nr:type II secretion system GspH family protein [Romboutsia timonensis]